MSSFTNIAAQSLTAYSSIITSRRAADTETSILKPLNMSRALWFESGFTSALTKFGVILMMIKLIRIKQMVAKTLV